MICRRDPVNSAGHFLARAHYIYAVLQVLGVKKVKGKAVPLQAWTCPESSRKLRLPDFVTTAQDGGRLLALRTDRFLSPGNTPGTHFC